MNTLCSCSISLTMRYLAIIIFVFIGCVSVSQNQNSEWLEHPRVDNWNNRAQITVYNPYDTNLENIPVTISIEDLEVSAGDLSPGNFYVYNHEDERSPIYQVDVLEEIELEEIVFLISLESGQKKTFHIYYADNGQAWPKQKRLTKATDMPGWESELFGYRSYGPFALDLFARDQDKKGLMLRHFYNGKNEQIFNYHEESEYGLDILHLGPTAGLGGVGLYVNNNITLMGASFEPEVVVSGPVRSIVKMDMKKWKSDFGTISVSRQATIYAHHYETMIEDQITGVNDNSLYAVGILKVEDSKTDFNEEEGLFLQWQNQGEDIGGAGIGLYIKPEEIERITEDEDNNFVLTTPPVSQSLKFWAFGAWDRGGKISNLSEFQDRAESIRKLQLPLEVEIGEIQYPSE